MNKNSKIYKTRRKLQKLSVLIFGEEIMSKIYFYIVLRQKLNLKQPKTFNEKIQWYKLYYCPQSPLVIKCTDKFLVREYLIEKGYSKNLLKIIGDWQNVSEINWDKLPKKFALKCNHGCGYNIICSNKDLLKKDQTLSIINKWLSEDFGYYNAELHYNRISKRIICEEFLESDSEFLPIDYKVHCFNGEPRFIMLCSERKDVGIDSLYNFFDLNWDKLNYSVMENKTECKKPLFLEKMIEISKNIAIDFPFVRVDFYEKNGIPIIGELTFTPTGGLDNTITHDADVEIGKMLDISSIAN